MQSEMRTKQAWNREYKILHQFLPENKRHSYWVGNDRYRAIDYSPVIEFLWDNNDNYKFMPPFPSKRTDGYHSMWL